MTAVAGDNFATKGKVVRDPVHGLISIRPDERYLLELIDSPEFQRLRRVRQLGVSNMTYPGAEHTRFAHSLGVLNFAGRILDHLRTRYHDNREIAELIDRHRRVVKAAALLHDTGHGPFSHMIERTFPAAADHEERTSLIITSEESQIPGILRKHDINPDEVRAIIDGTFPVRFLRDIVSSQLDADRMDYLLRDALMTGVEYGRYDAEWILHALCLGVDPAHHSTESPEHFRLCLDRSRGLHAAEQLIVARMHMSYQVYYHRATRAWEAHLLSLFHIASGLANSGTLPEATPPIMRKFLENRGDLSHAGFLDFDEPVVISAFQVWAASESSTEEQRTLRDLAKRFLLRQREFHAVDTKNPLEDSYKTLLDFQRRGFREKIDYYHDDAKFHGYKDFGSSMVHENNDEDPLVTGSKGIFLADTDPSKRAIPVEEDPRAVITPALAERKAIPLNRVFVRSCLA